MILDIRKMIVKESVKRLLNDLKIKGEFSKDTLDCLRELPNDTLIDVVDSIGYEHLLYNDQKTSNSIILKRLECNFDLDGICYVDYENNEYIIFITGHCLSKKDNMLILKNNFEQTIITTDLTLVENNVDDVIDDYLDRIVKIRPFINRTIIKEVVKSFLDI